MTKKDLERRNDFLLLQLKIINGLVNEEGRYDEYRIYEIIGTIMAITDADYINENIRFIERFNEPYNCGYKDMNIDDYK